jgi:hypothetical protein
MKSRTLSGSVIAFGLSMSSAVFAEVTQWRVADGGNDHYYNIVVTPVQTWVASKAQAESLGGYLASIRSPEENSWIWNAFNVGATAEYWTSTGPWPGYDGPVFGAYRAPNSTQWTWVSGETWDWSNWGWGAGPGEAGAQFIAHSSAWDDIGVYGGTSAGGNVSFIVEWNTNPIPAPAASALLALAGFVSRRRRT